MSFFAERYFLPSLPIKLNNISPRARAIKATGETTLNIKLRITRRKAVMKPVTGPINATFIFDLLDKPLTLVNAIAIKGKGIKTGRVTSAPNFLAIK